MQNAKGDGRSKAYVLVLLLSLAAGLYGCESLQRKFSRKPKGPVDRPSPVTRFQDYRQALSPIERYRKHLLVFEYWNAELLDAFKQQPVNPKRVQSLSAESLRELQYLRGLLKEETGRRLDPLLAERAQLDAKLRQGLMLSGESHTIQRQLEVQTRTLSREFSWRQVEHEVQDDVSGAAPGT